MRPAEGTIAIGPRRGPAPGPPPLQLNGCIENLFVSESGHVLVTGWLADEGCGSLDLRLTGTGVDLPVPAASLLRHTRPDVERVVREGPVDYGFVLFTQAPEAAALRQPLTLEIRAPGARFDVETIPDVISNRRMLDLLLVRASGPRAHGAAFSLHRFMAGPAGETAVSLFQAHVAAHVSRRSIHRFRPRPVACSFITVLFGSTEPVKVQPLLFRHIGIDFGEWIYVCNSPEDGETLLRLARLMADLYDIMITVILMPENVGFGAANNAAVSEAASHSIVLINPDVYPLLAHAAILQEALAGGAATALRGGLLFYDEHTMMHSGMYIDADTAMRGAPLNAVAEIGGAGTVELLRVEHFDKGVPFDEAHWRRPKRVPAITGAVMAFARKPFEQLGGFSTRYIYGHYEDADLSLRWGGVDGPTVGPVMVDPRLRLVHLEGQGAKTRGEQYHGAAILNRHLFTLRHGAGFARDPGPYKLARGIGG